MKFQWNTTVVDTDSSRSLPAARYLAANIMKICEEQMPRGQDILPWLREAYAWLRTFDKLQLDSITSFLSKLVDLRYIDSYPLNIEGDDNDTTMLKTIRQTVVSELTEHDRALVFGPATKIQLVPNPAAMVKRVIARLQAAPPGRIGLSEAVAHVITEIYPVAANPTTAPAATKRPHEQAPATVPTSSTDPPPKRRRVDSPSLTHVFLKGDNEEGLCGNFKRVRRWRVNNPVQGVIVQHVTRTFDVTLVRTNQPLAGLALDNYVTEPGSTVHGQFTQYWELWQVGADGQVSDGGEDTFGLCSIIPTADERWNTTKGAFTIAGTARFYPCTLTPDQIGFQPGDEESPAGGLYWSLTDPTEKIRAAGLEALGEPVRYTVRCRWDSSDDKKYPRTIDFAKAEARNNDQESSESMVEDDPPGPEYESDSDTDDPLFSRIYRRKDNTLMP